MIINETIVLQTDGRGDTRDITPQLIQIVADSNLKDGIVTIFVTGSTAGVAAIEFEPNLITDFKELWEKIASSNKAYHHDEAWGDANGYAHLRASLLGPSLVVPFADSKMVLGTWQQIVVVDFDNRTRERRIAVQVMGT